MFQKAVKSKSKLRCAIYGISGSGKTYTSLAIAAGLGNKIALIDSERGSASKYASIFNFDCYELQEKTIEEYIMAIENAGKGGYDVLIVDSLTHAWDAVKEYVDKIQSTVTGMRGAQAWSKGTPLQNKFINTLLNYDGHIIATIRTKTAWDFSKLNEKGKLKPEKIGLAPEQRQNIEYEFDLVLELNQEHVGTISKDRTGKFQDEIIIKPGERLGEALKDWLNEGKEIKKPAPRPTKIDFAEMDLRMGEFINGSTTVKNAEELTALYEKTKQWARDLYPLAKNEEEKKRIVSFVEEVTELYKDHVFHPGNREKVLL